MAQKALKSSKKALTPHKKQAPSLSVLKRGARVIPPKNRALVKQKIVSKRLSASINKNIEHVMASRAKATGKLTIMKSAADGPQLQTAVKK